MSWHMVGTCVPGTVVRLTRKTTPMTVVDHWQDEVRVQSTRSGRFFTWPDTAYVYIEQPKP